MVNEVTMPTDAPLLKKEDEDGKLFPNQLYIVKLKESEVLF